MTHRRRSAAHIERATHIEELPSVNLNGRDAHGEHNTLGFARGAQGKNAHNVPNHFQILVKPIKLKGRLFDIICSSSFIKDMMVYIDI